MPGTISAKEGVDARDIGTAFVAKVVEITPAAGASEIAVQWDFTNKWDMPLMVERFEESCGCLGGVTDQKEVAPGKTGHIRANFIPGGYRGKIRKSLHVRFVGFDKPVELVAEVTIPSSVELSSQELVWNGSADTSSKTVDVKAGTDADFTITGLAGVAEGMFLVKQEIVTPGRHYRVTITPTKAAGSDVQCLQIRTDSADLRDRVVAVFLRCGPSPAGQPPASTSPEP
ncbi:DUF1573 domain-containing protein [Akkermansiaceae bacterium]|nr:DUF1573 domain-containing protein [Akkermansiaceae bacterium]